MRELNWAVLGTGVIANEIGQAFVRMDRKIYGICNRTYEKAVDYAKKYQVKKIYKEYEELCRDEAVDVIYITTPHNTHYRFIRQALEQGKHVFAEKSITLNQEELLDLKELAEKNHVILAEAMTIWHMPLYKKLWEIVESGRIGKPQMITVNFGSYKEYNMNNRFFNRNLAGGAMLDIGVYALSIVRSFMESQPDQIVTQWKPAPTGVDEQASLLLMNQEGQMATVALTMHSKQPKRAMISCEKAYIEVMEFPRACRAVIVDAETGEREEITAGDTQYAIQYELNDMENAILTGDVSGLKFDHTLDVMEIMTYARRQWNMKYPEEES